MFKRKLCPKCKTGKYTYELDRRSPVCPYIGCYSGKKCPMYVKLEKPQKGGTKYGLQKDDDLLVYIDEIQATTLKNT